MSSSPTTPHAASSADPVERAVADRLAAAARAVPGVAGLHAGRFGEVTLLYPRHRVNGLRLIPTALEVHLVVDLGQRRPLPEIAAEVREVVGRLTDVPVDVHFADATEGTP